MGRSLQSPQIHSLDELQSYIDKHPSLESARITIESVHARDIFDMVELLKSKEDWHFENSKFVLAEGRKFALCLESLEFLIDQLIEGIDADIRAQGARALLEEAMKFRSLIREQPGFHSLTGFADSVLKVCERAVQAISEEQEEEEEASSALDPEDAADGQQRHGDGDGDEDGPDGQETECEHEAVQLGLLGALREMKAALKRLGEVRIMFNIDATTNLCYSDFPGGVFAYRINEPASCASNTEEPPTAAEPAATTDDPDEAPAAADSTEPPAAEESAAPTDEPPAAAESTEPPAAAALPTA